MDDRNIVLIGMMASGKTTVGGLLAAALGRPLGDTDALIEKKEDHPRHLRRRRGGLLPGPGAGGG